MAKIMYGPAGSQISTEGLPKAVVDFLYGIIITEDCKFILIVSIIVLVIDYPSRLKI